ncbi:MAG: S41 family peptidase [Muribaculaceae bacterium]|jgi:carboxyl-terminal processing protease|nr:S41 family peptidase [Muribaculaceae bacterium]
MKKLFYTVALLLCIGMCVQAATRSKKSAISRNIDIFSSVFKEMQTFYVDSIDADKSVTTAINAMLAELDPYTVYMPRSEQEDFKTMTTGEFGGIGSYIMQRDGNVYISGPHKDSPAYKAGLRAGDLIVSIDGDTMLGKSHSLVSDRLKGTPGTGLVVKIKRPYVEDSVFDVSITRAKIKVPSVPYYGVEKGNIGYIALNSYSESTADEVKQAVSELTANPAVKALVLDLRGNVGGLVESAVKVVGNFVPKGTEVLRTKGKGVMNEKVYKTTSAPIAPDIPLVVIIDGETASSAEITAGALQDLDRAVIVGTRSYGKGLVQTTRDMPYEGLLKVTVAKYYIPSGRLIQAIDYSHRNPDGTVSRIPDSLTNVFSTAHGRVVRDGGGITPDVEVKYPLLSRLTYNIMSDFWAFDFANRYVATHPDAPDLDSFEMSDSLYGDFKAFIDPAKFEYDRVCETMLERLRAAAKSEGYDEDSLTAQFDILEGMLRRPLERDLDKHREAIEPLVLREIMERYYFDPGRIRVGLRNDPGLDSAATVVQTAGRYDKILSPSNKPQKK